tara:strand:- start:520 stop:951 length:432 start_codon:yes stop_codon:yes gene_type:complete
MSWTFYKKHVKSAWVSWGSNKPVMKKPWGTEKVWSGFGSIHGKTLFIDKGKRTSLKYHRHKSEVLMFRKGKAEVMLGNELTLHDPIGHPFKIEIVSAGDSLMVQSGSPYRITALENCEIIEIGTIASDPPVRIEDDFGRVKKK